MSSKKQGRLNKEQLESTNTAPCHLQVLYSLHPGGKYEKGHERYLSEIRNQDMYLSESKGEHVDDRVLTSIVKSSNNIWFQQINRVESQGNQVCLSIIIV